MRSGWCKGLVLCGFGMAPAHSVALRARNARRHRKLPKDVNGSAKLV